MLSYGDIPVLAGLSKVDVARLIPELEEVELPAGQVLVRMGDPGDALFILRKGELSAEVDGPDGTTVLGLIGPGQVIGEVALLTGERRMATVRALDDAALWRLSRKRFEGLISKYPSLGLHFNRILGQRLVQTSARLGEAKGRLAELGSAVWGSLGSHAWEVAVAASPLPALTPGAVETLLGRGAQQGLEELIAAHGVGLDAGGRYVLVPTLRSAAMTRGREQMGQAGYRELARTLAERCLEAGETGGAVGALLEAGEPERAGALLVEHREHLLRLWAPGQVLEWIDHAVHTPDVKPALLRTGGMVAERAGLEERALAYYDRAVAAAVERGETGERMRSADALNALICRRGGGAPAFSHPTTAICTRAATAARKRWRTLAGLGVSGLLFWAVFQSAPLLGLEPGGVKVLTLLAVAGAFWGFDLLPNYFVGLLTCVAAFLWGAVPASVALVGFTSTTFFLLLTIFGLMGLVARSGLVYRAALLGMRILPPTLRGQATLLLATGLSFSAIFPTEIGRISMSAPLVLDLKESLGYGDRSQGSAFLAMSAWLGYGQGSVLFLTGSAKSLILYSLLLPLAPEPVTWSSWLVAALPLGLISLLATFWPMAWLLKPEPQRTVAAGTLEAQLKTLGPMEYQERLGLTALLALIPVFLLQPWHGVNPAWVGLFMIGLLFMLGLERTIFRQVDWNTLLYFGGFVSIAALIEQTGAGAGLGAAIRPLIGAIAGSPYVLLTVLALAAMALHGAAPWLPHWVILALATFPLAPALGYHPLVFGLIILAGSAPGLIPQFDHIGYAGLTGGADGRLVSAQQFQRVALLRSAAFVLAVLCSVPYWRLLGMVP